MFLNEWINDSRDNPFAKNSSIHFSRCFEFPFRIFAKEAVLIEQILDHTKQQFLEKCLIITYFNPINKPALEAILIIGIL